MDTVSNYPGVLIATFSKTPRPNGRQYALLARNSAMGFLLEIKWSKTSGFLVSGGPKGWTVRRDREKAMRTGDVHYHCHYDGEEYVVKQSGHGSHDTKSGTRLPKKLGKFLFDELRVPLRRDGTSYVINFAPWPSPKWRTLVVDIVLNSWMDDDPESLEVSDNQLDQ